MKKKMKKMKELDLQNYYYKKMKNIIKQKINII